MHYKVCLWLLLGAAAVLQVGCAGETPQDASPAPTMEAAPNPMPDHDDSHGWGASVGGAH